MRNICIATRSWIVMMAGAMVVVTPMPTMAAETTPLLVDVEQGDGTVSSGRLERIDAAGVRLADVAGVEEGILTVPSDRVRAVRRTTGATADESTGQPTLLLTMIDGSTLSGTDFAWDGSQPAVLVRPEGRIELPVGRVRSIAWPPAGATPAAAPEWQGAIPEGTESDVVVVGSDASHEFVECAITNVTADTVTVVLDDETIPVKRSKVIGLQWLRGEQSTAADAPGRAVVSVFGGGLRASRLEWSADALVIDGEIRLPATMFSAVDYAAGRIVTLASLTADNVSVEPWFGGLLSSGPGAGPAARADGLAAFFSPRTIDAPGNDHDATQPAAAGQHRATGGAAAPSILMRPRTVAIWRLPPDSRRFHAVVAPAAGPQAADAAVVTVAVDDREVFRRQIDAAAGSGEATAGKAPQAAAAGIPIDVDLTSGRRLTVTVDFVPGGGIGGAVRFGSPVIER